MIIFFTLLITDILAVLFFCICYFLFKWVGKFFHKKVRYLSFGIITLVLCLIWNLLALYGYAFGRFKYEVIEVDHIDNRVPDAFDGYRIVQISDLHISGFNGHEAFVDTIVNAINDLHPDLICFTGDLVSISHEEVIPYIYSLRNLAARDGVVSILGNHDYAVYQHSFITDEQREEDRLKLIKIQRDSLDWKLLLNENLKICHGEDSIFILGLENQNCGPHQKVRRGDMTETMRGTEGAYRVLLSHDPSQWDEEVKAKTDIPLTLCGHTHAMQFKIFGWTPCRFLYERSDGLYVVENQSVYVNIGVGELLPFRIGATPEITLHILHNN